MGHFGRQLDGQTEAPGMVWRHLEVVAQSRRGLNQNDSGKSRRGQCGNHHCVIHTGNSSVAILQTHDGMKERTAA